MLFLLVWQHLLTSKAAAGHRRPFAFCFCSSLFLQSSLLSLVHFCLAYTILVLFRATCILRCCSPQSSMLRSLNFGLDRPPLSIEEAEDLYRDGPSAAASTDHHNVGEATHHAHDLIFKEQQVFLALLPAPFQRMVYDCSPIWYSWKPTSCSSMVYLKPAMMSRWQHPALWMQQSLI